ncbi:uncharacterized protein [Henckelia pumila]|uniref:uncharacterized protein n=1 Tax=Henckelia pumila TaxID=405737 RepID=UPI003C6DF7FF
MIPTNRDNLNGITNVINRTAMQTGGGGIRAEEVISKLKDDGDFDRLRVKIIRKFKENEELRGNIISLVRQSAALNSQGAENMKPRQLSDAVHREIGDKLMSQVSDGLWNIIRSADGMQTEITETVQSVYEKMLNPQRDDNGQPSSSMNYRPIRSDIKNTLDSKSSAGEIDGSPLDREPNEPPGFSLNDLHRSNEMNNIDQQNKIGLHPSSRKRRRMKEVRDKNLHSEDLKEPNNFDLDGPPGYSSSLEHNKSVDASDEDPDVPPGFG